MTPCAITAGALAAWRERERVSGAQAAFLLAGKVPVKNPSPTMARPIIDMYRHILWAVKTGKLATIEGVRKRIDVDPEWLDSLTLEELHAWSQPWETLADVGSVDPDADVKQYRLELNTAEFFEWAEGLGLFESKRPASDEEAKRGMLPGWWYVLPLRLAVVNGWVGDVGTPRGLLKAVRKDMEGKPVLLRIPANVTGHSGDRDRFAHPSLAGSGFVS